MVAECCVTVPSLQAVIERSNKQDLEALRDLREQLKSQEEEGDKYVALNDEFENLKQRFRFLICVRNYSIICIM